MRLKGVLSNSTQQDHEVKHLYCVETLNYSSCEEAQVISILA